MKGVGELGAIGDARSVAKNCFTISSSTVFSVNFVTRNHKESSPMLNRNHGSYAVLIPKI